MREYTSENLRNVGIVAHGKAGKTSLTEALLYSAGMVTRLGKVVEGSATTDYEPEEIRRKITIGATMAPCEWLHTKINFIDTPGFVDFLAEVKGAVRAVDSALVVLCATAGVEVETERVWRYADESKLPRLIFVNKMDRENVDFNLVVEQVKSKFNANAVILQLPIGTEDSFRGVVDLLKMKAIIYQDINKYEETDIPEDMLEDAEIARQMMVEGIAESNDELLAKYLEGEELTNDELIQGLIDGVKAVTLFPVLCGSATKNIGVAQLLDAIHDYIPSPVDKEYVGINPTNEDVASRKVDDPFSAIVFKTTADPFVGRLSFLRILSGSLKSDTTIYNASKDKSERIGNLLSMRGKQQEVLKVAHAGDIVVIAKLQETNSGDTICDKNNPIVYDRLTYPKPMFTMYVAPKNKGDEDKIGTALARIMDEDPTIKVSKCEETGQQLVTGMGEMHLEIMKERMLRKFGLEVVLDNPKVAYRETIRGSAKVEGKHKKQSGGHGQFGHVWLEIEPLPSGEGFEFVDSIFGGAVPRQYIPAVEKGVKDTLKGGILAGYPMVDVKVTLFDGSYHNVDSSEMAFKTAAALAIKKGVMQASPILLEPIYNLVVYMPESFMGDIIGDINGKRGRILGMDSLDNKQGVVKAQVPQGEMFRYAVELRSLTQGRGSFDMEFSHYEEVPHKVAEAIIAEKQKTAEH